MRSEFLGNRSLVYLQIGESEYIASLKQNVTQTIGDSIQVNIAMKRTHFFDPESGNRIRQEGA